MPSFFVVRVGVLAHLTRDTEGCASRASVIPTLDIHTPHTQVLLAVASPCVRLHGIVLGDSITEDPTRIAVSSATVWTLRPLHVVVDRRVDERRERLHHSVKGGSPSGSSVTDVDDVGTVNGVGDDVFVAFVDSPEEDMFTNLLRAKVPIVVSPLSMNV